MIIVRLWGGLGNQMFQYACGYAVAKRNSENLVLDTRFFTDEFLNNKLHFSKQELNILNFPIDYTERINENGELRFINTLQQRLISRIIRIPSQFSIKATSDLMYVKETRLSYFPYIRILNAKRLYLDGYWQCESYFNEVRTDLLRQFSLNEYGLDYRKLSQRLIGENTVAIHVRRGDYVNNSNPFSNLYLLEESYYMKAINQAITKLKDPIFVFFSNDIEWCKKTFVDLNNVIFVSGEHKLSDVEELLLMSRCQNQIIANSTYSWWAAWLNLNPNKLVWAPERWFGNKNIIPSEWIKLPL